MNTNRSKQIQEEMPEALPLPIFLLTLLASVGGALAAILLIPTWLPALETSINGGAPHAFWFLSRSSAFTAYLLLWISMCLGLLITNKLARLWPGGPVAFDLHQYTSLLGVAIALFHGLILLGDQYLNAGLFQVVVPFGVASFQPVWVGIGQLSFYLMAIVSFSFYVRKQITPKIWRSVHFISFISFAFALLHGITSGTDTTAVWAQLFYWSTGGVFLLLLVYRILVSYIKPVTARQSS